MKNIKLEKEILDFFNKVKTVDEIKDKIIVDPKFKRGILGIGGGIKSSDAKKIIDFRRSLPDKKFQYIEQIENIHKVSLYLFHNILYSFRGTHRSERWRKIIDWFKKNKVVLNLDRFQRINQSYIEGSIVIDYQKVPLTIYPLDNSELWELSLDIEEETSISSLSDLLKAFGGKKLKGNNIPLSVNRISRIKIVELKARFSPSEDRIVWASMVAQVEKSWKLLPQRLSVYNSVIQLNIQAPDDVSPGKLSALAEGFLRVGKVTAPIILKKEESEDKWTLTQKKEKLVALESFTNIERFWGRLSLPSLFPKKILKLKNFMLSEMVMEFSGDLKKISFCRALISSTKPWVLGRNGLIMNQLDIDLELKTLSDSSRAVDRRLRGLFKVNDAVIPVVIHIPEDIENWVIKTDPRQDWPKISLKDLPPLLNGYQAEDFLPNFIDVKTLSIKEYGIHFAANSEIPQRVSITFADINVWEIIPKHLTLNYAEFQLILDNPYNIQGVEVNGVIAGDILIGSSDYAKASVIMEFDRVSRKWTLKKTGKKMIALPKEGRLLGLPGREAFMDVLPDTIDPITDLALSGLEATLSYGLKKMESVSMRFTAVKSWEIVEDWHRLGELQVQADISGFEDVELLAKGDIKGFVKINETEFYFISPLPVSESGLTLYLRDPMERPVMSDVSDLISEDILEKVVPGINNFDDLELSALSVEFDPDYQTINDISVNIVKFDEWPILEKDLSLRDSQINLTFDSPLTDERKVNGEITGVLPANASGETTLPVKISLSDGEPEWSLELVLQQDEESDEKPGVWTPSLPDIRNLIQGKDFTDFLPSGLVALNDFLISELKMTFNAQTKLFSSLSMFVNAEESWSAIDGWLRMDEVSVKLDMGDISAPDYSYQGEINGKLSAQDTDIPVKVSLPASDGELVFELPEKIQADKIADISSFFGEFKLESFLPNLEDFREFAFSDLKVRFNAELNDIKLINFLISIQEKWFVIFDELYVQNPEIYLNISEPLSEEREISGKVVGALKGEREELDIPVQIDVSNQSDSWPLNSVSQSQLASLSLISGLPGGQSLLSILPAAVGDSKNLSLTSLDASFSPNFADISQIEFKFGLENNWNLAPGLITFKQTDISLDISRPLSPLRVPGAMVDGEMIIGKSETIIPISFKIPDSGSDQILSLTSREDVFVRYLKDLKIFPGVKQLLSLFPYKLLTKEKASISSLEFDFQPQTGEIAKISYILRLEDEWSLASGRLNFGDLGVKVEVERPLGADFGFKESVNGLLKIGPLEVPIRFAQPETGGGLNLNLVKAVDAENSSSIYDLAPNFKFRDFFDNWDEEAPLELSKLDIRLSSNCKKIDYMFLEVALKNDWDVIPDSFALQSASVELYMSSESGADEKIKGRLKGLLTAGEEGSVKIPVELPITSKINIWSLRLDKGGLDVFIPKLSDLSGAPGGAGLIGALPKGLSDVAGYHLSELEMELKEGLGEVNKAAYHLDNDRSWEVVPGWLPLSAPDIKLNLDNDSGQLEARDGKIEGRVLVGDSFFTLEADLPYPSSGFALRLPSKVLVSDPAGLSRWLGGFDLDSFLPNLSSVEELCLQTLKFFPNEKFEYIERVELSLSSDGSWAIIPDWLSISDAKIKLEITCSADSQKEAQGQIIGNMRLGQTDAAPLMTINILPADQGWEFISEDDFNIPMESLAELKLDGGLNLSDVLPGGLGEAKGLILSDLKLSFASLERKVSLLSFVISSSQAWNFVPDWFPLQRLDGRIDIKEPMADMSVGGQLSGLIKLGSTEFPFSASLPLSSSGMTLRLTEKTALSEVEDLSWLLKILDIDDNFLPASFSNMETSEIELKVNSSFSSIYSLSLEAALLSPFNLPGGLAVDNASISLKVVRLSEFSRDISASIRGELLAGGQNKLPTLISLDKENDLWLLEVETDEPVSLERSELFEKLSLSSSEKLFSPATLNENISLTDLSLKLAPGFESLSKVSLAFQVGEEWIINKDLPPIKNMEINLEVSRPLANEPVVMEKIDGSIRLENAQALVSVIPKASGEAKLSLRKKLTFIDTKELSVFLELFKLGNLSRAVTGFSELSLSEMDMSFELSSNLIKNLDLRFETSGYWKRVAEILRVYGSAIQVKAAYPLEKEKSVSVDINGVLHFEGREIPIIVSPASGKDAYQLRLDPTANVRFAEIGSLAVLLEEDRFTSRLPRSLVNNGEIGLSELSALVDDKGKISEFSAEFVMFNSWNVVNNWLPLNRPVVKVAIDKRLGATNTFGASVEGELNAGATALKLKTDLSLMDDECGLKLVEVSQIGNISDLDMLANGLSVEEYIFDSYDAARLTLQGFEAEFNSKLQTISNISLSLKTEGKWINFSDDLKLSAGSLDLDISKPLGKDQKIVPSIRGAILSDEESWEIPIRLIVEEESGVWLLSQDSQNKVLIPELAGFSRALGMRLTEFLPPGFDGIKGLELSDFSGRLSEERDTLFETAFEFSSQDGWSALPDGYHLRQVAFSCDIKNPLGPAPQFVGEATGALDKGGEVYLPVRMAVDGSARYQLELSEKVSFSDYSGLFYFIDKADLGKFASHIQSLPVATFVDFKVDFDAGLKKVKQIFLKAEIGEPWFIIPDYAPVSKAVLTLEAAYPADGEPKLDARLEGAIVLGAIREIEIPVAGSFDVGKDEWNLRMIGDEVELVFWSDLESLSVVDKISGCLPNELRAGQNLSLSALALDISPGLSKPSGLEFEVKLSKMWPLLPKWRALSQITVQGQIDDPLEKSSKLKGAVDGVIAVGTKQFPVSLSLPSGKEGWFLQSTGAPTLSGDIIFGLLLENFKLLRYFPRVSDVKGFQIKNMEVEFDLNFQFISRLLIDLEFEETWSLLDDRILFKDGRMLLEIERLRDGESGVQGFVRGKILSGENTGLEIPATLNISSFSEDWDLKLDPSDSVHISRRNDLDHMVGKPNILSCLPGDLAEVDDFILDDLLIYLSPTSKKITSIEFALKALRLWSAAPDWYPIHDINVHFFIDEQSPEDKSVKAELKGNLSVGTLNIPISAPLPRPDLEIYFERTLELNYSPQSSILLQDLGVKEFLGLLSEDSVVSQAEIFFNKEKQSAERVSLVVNSEECSLIPQKLVVKDAELKIESESPYEDQRSLKAVVKGTMPLGELSHADMPIVASVSNIEGEWLLSLAPGSGFILANLRGWLAWLGISRPEFYLPTEALEIPGVELVSLDIKFSALHKKFVSVSCGLTAAHNWKILPDWFGLESLHIELFLNYSGDSNERLLGEVSGIMNLGEARLPIIFDLPYFTSKPTFRLAENGPVSAEDLFLLREQLDWEGYFPGLSKFESLSLSELNVEFSDRLKGVDKIHLDVGADGSWNMLGGDFSINDVNIELKMEGGEVPAESVFGTVKGVSVFKGAGQTLQIPMIADVSERPSKWSLKLASAENIDLGGWNIMDLLEAARLGDESWFAEDGFLAADLKEILSVDGLELIGLEIESLDERADYIYLVLQKSREWTLIPEYLAINDLKIRLELNRLSGDSPELNATLSGFVKSGGLELPVYSRLSSETSGIKLELAEETNITAADLYSLLDKEKIKGFAPNFGSLGNVRADRFDIWLSSEPNRMIEKLSFGFSGFENWAVVPQALELRDGKLDLSLAYSSAEDKYEAQGIIDGNWLPREDNKLIPVTVSVPEDGLDWTLNLKPGFHVLQSEMSDLVKVATGSPLFSLLPSELDSISGLILNTLKLRFRPEDRITNTSFNLKTAYIWECVPGLLPLGELNISFDIAEPMSVDRELTGGVQGALFLGCSKIPVSFVLSYSDWKLSLTEETTLAHISDLDVALGDFDLPELFPEIDRLSDIRLSAFNLQINPFSKAVSQIDFKLNTDNFNWSIGRSSLGRTVINLEVKRPLEADREIQGVVQGIIYLNEEEDAYIPIEVNITSGKAEDWRFNLLPAVSGPLYSLSELEDLFMDGEVFGGLPTRFKDPRDFGLTEFSGKYSHKLNKIQSFSMKLSGENIWQIIPDWFSFTDVEVEIEAQNRDDGKSEISGAVSGKIKVGETSFSLHYPLSSSPTDFKLQLKEKVVVRKIEELSRFLGNFELETYIPNIELLPELTVNKTEISFNDEFSEVTAQTISFDGPAESAWTGLPGRLALSGLSADLALQNPFSSQRDSLIGIQGLMLLDEEGAVKIPVVINKPYQTDDSYLVLAEKGEYPSFGVSELKGLAETDFLETLPDELSQMPEAKFLTLNMSFGSRFSQLSAAAFSVKLLTDCRLVSNWFPLRQAVLSFGVMSSSSTVKAEIEGVIGAGETALKMWMPLSEDEPGFQLYLKEKAKAKADDLWPLLGNFDWEKYFPGFDQGDELELINFGVKIRPDFKTMESCSLRLLSGGPWRLIGDQFPMVDLSVDLEIISPSSGAENVRSLVRGNLLFGSSGQLKVPALLNFHAAESLWTARLNDGEDIVASQLDHIGELLGDARLKSRFPAGLTSMEGMTLTDFKMTLPNNAEEAASLSFSLQSVRVWQILPDWPPIDNIIINVNVENPTGEQAVVEADIQAMIQLGGVSIPATASLPFVGFDLKPGEEVWITSLRDLSDLSPEMDLEQVFPGLAQVESLSLSALRARFNEDLTKLERVYLKLQYNQDWDIIPEALAVYDGQLELEAAYPIDSDKTFFAEINGSLKGSPGLPPNIPIRIDINEVDASWKLQLSDHSDLVLILPGLGNLSRFFGPKEVFMNLPGEFLGIEGFSLSSLEAEIYPYLKEIVELSFVMETVYSLEPISGWAAVNNIEMDFYLDNPLSSSSSCRANVQGFITNNDLELPLNVVLFKPNVVFELSEAVSLDSLSDLSSLLNNFEFDRHIPGYDAVSSYSLNRMEFEWDLKFEEIKRVSLQLAISETCSLASEKLTLKDGVVDLDIDYPFSSYRKSKGTLKGLAQTAAPDYPATPVELAIDSDSPYWKMKLVDTGEAPAVSWAALESLPAGEAWSGSLYQDLKELSALKLESCDIIFRAGFEGLYKMDFVITASDNWSVTEELNLSGVSVSSEIIEPLGNPQVRGKIQSWLQLGDVELPLVAFFPEESLKLALDTQSYLPFYKVSDISKIGLGIDPDKYLPGLSQANNLRISELEIEFYPETRSLSFVGCEIQAQERWSIAHNLSLDDYSVRLKIAQSKELVSEVEAQIRGVIPEEYIKEINSQLEGIVPKEKIIGSAFPVVISVGDDKLWEVKLDPEVALRLLKFGTLRQLPGSDNWFGHIPEALGQVKDWQLFNFSFNFLPATKKFFDFKMSLASQSCWRVLPNVLKVKELKLELEAKDFQDAQLAPSGKITGIIPLNKVSLPVAVSLPLADDKACFELTQETSLCNVFDLSFLPDEADLKELLSDLPKSNSVSLGALSIVCDEKFRKIESCRLEIQLKESRQITDDGLKLEDVSIKTTYDFTGEAADVKAVVSAYLTTENNSIPVQIEISPESKDWFIKLSPQTRAAKVNLNKSPANKTLFNLGERLPESFYKLKGMSASEFVLVYSPAERSLSKLDIELETFDCWDIIPDWFTASNLKLKAEIENPMSSKAVVNGEVTGTIKSGETDIGVKTALPFRASDLSFSLIEAETFSKVGDFNILAGKFYAPNVLIGWENVSRLLLSKMEVKFDLILNRIAELSFDLSVNDSWDIIKEKLTVKETSIELDIKQYPTGEIRLTKESVEGLLRTGNEEVDIPVVIKRNENNRTLSKASSQDLPFDIFGGGSALPGGETLSEFLSETNIKEDSWSVKELVFAFPSNRDEIEEVSCQLTSSEDWKVLPDDTAVIKKVAAVYKLSDSLKEARISGVTTIGELELPVFISLPSPGPKLMIQLDDKELTLSKEDVQALSLISDEFNIQEFLPELETVKDLKLYGMDLEIDPKLGDFSQASFELRSDNKWQIIPKYFSLTNIDVYLRISTFVDFEKEVEGKISGLLTIGKEKSLELPAELIFAPDDTQWKLTPAAEDRLFDNASELFGIIENQDLLAKLPDTFKVIHDLELSDLEALFSADLRKMNSVKASLKTIQAWEFVAGWRPLSQVSAQVESLSPMQKTAPTSGSLKGVLQIASAAIPVEIPLFNSDGVYSLSLLEKTPVDRWMDICLWFGFDQILSVFDGSKRIQAYPALTNKILNSLKDLVLSSLFIEFDGAKSSMQKADVALESSSSIKLSENFPSVDDISVKFKIKDPLKLNSSISTTIQGLIHIEEEPLLAMPVELILGEPGAANDLELASKQEIKIRQLSQLNIFLGGNDLFDYLPANLSGLGPVSLSEFKFGFGDDKNGKLAFDVQFSKKWILVPEQLSLDRFKLHVEIDLGDQVVVEADIAAGVIKIDDNSFGATGKISSIGNNWLLQAREENNPEVELFVIINSKTGLVEDIIS